MKLADKLRQVSAQAKQHDAAVKAAAEERQAELNNNAAKRIQAEAAYMFDCAKMEVERVAALGSNAAKVMELSYADVDREGNTASVIRNTIQGRVAKLLISMLESEGLEYRVEQWNDGVGITGGYHLFAVW